MKKKRIIIIGLSILLVTICSVATYAYFTANITGNSDNKNVKVDMSKMKLEFSDKTGLVKADNINPGWTYQKKVSVTNTGTVPVTYDLVWLSLANEIEKDEMVYSITCDNCNGIDESPVPSYGGENLKIVTNTIEKDATQEYTINFTFKEINDLQDYNQNKEFKGNIGIKENNTYEESPIGLLSDTDWEYTIDDENNKVTLTRYISENKNVEIYPIYLKDNKKYKTIIKEGASSNTLFLKQTNNNNFIEKVKFMGNIEFENNSIQYLFSGCTNLKEIDLLPINTSNVTDMRWMFYNCSSLTSLDLSNFNTSNVTSMYNMFFGCSSLTSLDVSNFDTSNVTSMSGMFNKCSLLTNLDVTNFDTSNVTYMAGMFGYCSSLTSIDVTNFDTSNVTYMGWMFGYCSSLTSIDVTNFDTSNVTDMHDLFNHCSSLTSIDVSNFDTSKVTNMSEMFTYCSSLTSIDVSNFDTSKVTDMSWMFNGCSSLKKLNIAKFNFNSFSGTYGLPSFDNVPTDVEITTNETIKNWLNNKYPKLTNITVV